MSYPQGYLYQAPGSLALYSCPAYGASALAAPRSEELARSASGSAFSPYPGSAAFTAQAATGFGSPLQYSADAAAAGFPSYMVTARADTGTLWWAGGRGAWGRRGAHRPVGAQATGRPPEWPGQERPRGRPATSPSPRFVLRAAGLGLFQPPTVAAGPGSVADRGLAGAGAQR